MNTYDKVPIERVLAAMNNPKGGVLAYVARDYYYIHYATPKEQKKMNKEDTKQVLFAVAFGVCFVVLIVAVVVSKF